MRAEELSYFGPPHEFMDSEELKELGIEGDLGVAGIFVDPMQEIGLLIVVRS
jgi:hypothetical protein